MQEYGMQMYTVTSQKKVQNAVNSKQRCADSSFFFWHSQGPVVEHYEEGHNSK